LIYLYFRFLKNAAAELLDFILSMIVSARRWENARSEWLFCLSFLVPNRALLLTVCVLGYIALPPQRSFATYTWYADELGSLPHCDPMPPHFKRFTSTLAGFEDPFLLVIVVKVFEEAVRTY
jgi:hypothetical protein